MKRLCLWLLLMGTLLTGGCWDARSLEQRAFVIMMGIDRTESGGYRISMQIERGLVGEAQKGKKPEGAGVRILVGEGMTVRNAMDEAAGNQLARQLDLSFLDVVVLGRTAAADLEELDWIVRSFRMNTTAYVVVALEDAETVVRGQSPGTSVPQQFALYGLLPGAWNTSPTIVPSSMWLMFNRNYYTPLEDPFAAVLGIGEVGLEWKGMAVFNGRRLAGYLEPEDAVIFNLLIGHRFQRALVADLPQWPEGVAVLSIQGTRVRRKVTWEADRPVIHLTVSVSGDLQRLTGTKLRSPEVGNAIQNALAQRLEQEIRATIGRFQQLSSDPVGFGELARQAAPYRPEVQSGAAWHEAFRKARLEIRTKAVIMAPGYMK